MGDLPLDSRQAAIARLLVDREGVLSVDEVAAELQQTARVIRYNLPSVGAFLAGFDLQLQKRRGVGVWIEGPEAARAALKSALNSASGPAVLDSGDRQSRVLLALLEATPDAIRSESLETSLGVSRPTIRRDVRAAEGWLEQHRLHLRRLPGVGLAVRGSEVEVRAALLALTLEHVPARVLSMMAVGSAQRADDSGQAGLARYVEELDLPTFQAILSAELKEADEQEPTILTATVGVAILANRARSGHPARLVRGRLRSLLDHPVSEPAQRIAAAISERLDVRLPMPEIASITESLLGFVELTDPLARPEAHIVTLVDRLVEAAAARLHPSLSEDKLLRASLTDHLRRLQVRVRYGLPVSNPLQQEVRKRFPDVYAVAEEILADAGPMDGAAIPTEEVGFLTMYLAGSLERHSLRPKVRVTVVCPAGMATAWILVSRLLAEFPQLEIAQVISKTAFEHEIGEVSTDLVVSTVPLRDDDPGDIPAIVVNPLLDARDVRRMTRFLGLPHT